MVRLLATPCIFSCQTFWMGMTTISILLKMDEGVNFIAWYLLFKMNTKTSITTFHNIPAAESRNFSCKAEEQQKVKLKFPRKKRDKKEKV